MVKAGFRLHSTITTFRHIVKWRDSLWHKWLPHKMCVCCSIAFHVFTFDNVIHQLFFNIRQRPQNKPTPQLIFHKMVPKTKLYILFGILKYQIYHISRD